MADPDYVFMDGFDNYSEISNDNSLYIGLLKHWKLAALSYWRTREPLAGGGHRLYWNYDNAGFYGALTHATPQRMARCIGGTDFEYNSNTTLSGAIVFVGEGTDNNNAAALGVYCNYNTGALEVRLGDWDNAILASVEGVFTLGVPRKVMWDLCPKNVGGWAKVWVDNELLIDYSGGDASAQATDGFLTFGLAPARYSGYDNFFNFCYISDVDNGELPPMNLPIIVTDYPDEDISGDSIIGRSMFGHLSDYSNGQSYANRVILKQLEPPASGNINSVFVSFANTYSSHEVKAVVYADNAGSPGALLGEGPVTIGVLNGANELPLSAPVPVVEGQKVWVGYAAGGGTGYVNTSVNNSAALGEDGLPCHYFSNTFTNALPANAPSTATHQPITCWTYVEGHTTRHDSVNQYNVSLDTVYGFNTLDAVAEQDVYGFPALPAGLGAVICVALSVRGLRGEAGAVTFDAQMISNAVTGAGDNPGTTLATTMDSTTSYFLRDPNGSVDWTPAAVDLATAGIEIKTLV